ncbi:prepilin-type N-terminal cleavage/methylation domain-containing protein [Haloferula luteola]|uniref:Prepilin-type N-terminal cleavage/methylation domain-containing protein n=1 Tax=Haloferula luteola TaxID=595692 RepID=A0A840VG34_9BACT|nr:type II secretion system protein [Haloferula luteola]MBB5352779.1 prepilin-type N-terminal cleavage/methylation domain-containing protein [Haloferula luteola]
MKMNKSHRRGFTLVELLVVIVIIAALAGLSAPMVLRQRKAADRTQAINNAKQVGMYLIEFDQEFGSFPDNNTAQDVKDSTGSSLDFSGNKSNDYFRQLIAYGADNEDIFYTKTPYTRKPDKNLEPGKALSQGEVGFGYVMLDATTGQNSTGNSNRPVLATPLLDAQTNWTFDMGPYGGKAVILRLDNSVEAPIIRETDNNVTVGGGKTLQKNGKGTVWGSVQPVIKGPDAGGVGSGTTTTTTDSADDLEL